MVGAVCSGYPTISTNCKKGRYNSDGIKLLSFLLSVYVANCFAESRKKVFGLSVILRRELAFYMGCNA